jgi:hypothetical protein
LAVSGLVCVAITIFAASAYVTLDMGQARPPLHGPVHYGLLVAHIFTGTVAVLAGVSQFWPGLRRRHPRVHRVMGRGYFAAVLPSSVLGVVCAQLSLYGLASSAPLTVIGVLWFISAVWVADSTTAPVRRTPHLDDPRVRAHWRRRDRPAVGPAARHTAARRGRAAGLRHRELAVVRGEPAGGRVVDRVAGLHPDLALRSVESQHLEQVSAVERVGGVTGHGARRLAVLDRAVLLFQSLGLGKRAGFGLGDRGTRPSHVVPASASGDVVIMTSGCPKHQY